MRGAGGPDRVAIHGAALSLAQTQPCALGRGAGARRGGHPVGSDEVDGDVYGRRKRQDMGVHPSLLWPLDFLFGPMRGQGSPPPRPAQAALHPRPQPEPKLPALVYSEDRPALR
ncbi:unnamed protein product [Rangifer tarandus platyrhynchus]|uniref:Uncharacterized protein n=1 Tax=Rangifer tarandus platyrhynchus TaxID=3082113 RepID=A0AC59YHD5_RANTA